MSAMFNEVTTSSAGKKQILFLTGTRADFGKMKPLIRAVHESTEFEYEIFATGMHMLARYGSTVIEIRRAGFENVFTYFNQDGHESGMDLVMANTVRGLAYYVREFPPDLIVVHGDRVEALAGAIVGALNNIRVAHVEGGELSGTVDELIRHAVSKLSHLHFVSHDDARRRLVQMGELESSVFVIGSPNIDVMLSDSLPGIDDVRKRYDIPFEKYAILVYHPVTTEIGRIRRNTEVVIDAAERSGMNFVVIYPNNDSGSNLIVDALNRLRGHPRFALLPSMRFEYYLTLLKHATAIVGNSSSGIHEAPVYGVPTVNIGTRQDNRFLHESILNVPEDADAILGALERLPRAVEPTRHFGSGNSATLFLKHLRTDDLWRTPKQKQFLDAQFPLAAMGLAMAGAAAAGGGAAAARSGTTAQS